MKLPTQILFEESLEHFYLIYFGFVKMNDRENINANAIAIFSEHISQIQANNYCKHCIIFENVIKNIEHKLITNQEDEEFTDKYLQLLDKLGVQNI